MVNETKESIDKFVDLWMNGHEPDTFIKNGQGMYIYSSGPSSINLKVFFSELLEDYIESKY